MEDVRAWQARFVLMMIAVAVGVALVVVAFVYTGCVCTCVTASAEVDAFESACVQHGGYVRSLASTRRSCVGDAGVIATWVVTDGGVDDDDGG